MLIFNRMRCDVTSFAHFDVRCCDDNMIKELIWFHYDDILMMQTGSTCENAFTDDSAHVLHDHGYNHTAVISPVIPNSRNSEDKESNDGIHWQTVTGSFKRPRKLVSNGPDI
ncbi:hypothetical protein J6590_081767 [Homalodisca vitripennis]|nr:hypothetical protein J6590_081767 [Homalodisca vitripennis]